MIKTYAVVRTVEYEHKQVWHVKAETEHEAIRIATEQNQNTKYVCNLITDEKKTTPYSEEISVQYIGEANREKEGKKHDTK
jgi:hypothetical protein